MKPRHIPSRAPTGSAGGSSDGTVDGSEAVLSAKTHPGEVRFAARTRLNMRQQRSVRLPFHAPARSRYTIRLLPQSGTLAGATGVTSLASEAAALI